MLKPYKKVHINPYCDTGFMPDWLKTCPEETDLAEHLNTCYAHGGGWRAFKGFELQEDNSLQYPDDPAYPPQATFTVGADTVCMYQHSWVAIIKPDRSYEVCRMD